MLALFPRRAILALARVGALPSKQLIHRLVALVVKPSSTAAARAVFGNHSVMQRLARQSLGIDAAQHAKKECLARLGEDAKGPEFRILSYILEWGRRTLLRKSPKGCVVCVCVCVCWQYSRVYTKTAGAGVLSVCRLGGIGLRADCAALRGRLPRLTALSRVDL